jgi:cytochrome P450
MQTTAIPESAHLPLVGGTLHHFGGKRICIGNPFALMEAALVLATITQRFRLRTEPGHRVVPEPAITLRFKHGLRMTLTKRGAS